MTPTELMKHWRYRVHRVQLAHYDSARKYGKYHIRLGLPAIVLSTIVGTSIFTSLGSAADKSDHVVLTIVVGLLSVVSAALVSLQTFLRYSDLAEKHRVAGAKFANLKHRIEMLGTMPPTTIFELNKSLLLVEDEWSKLREDSPNIPTDIWRNIEKSLTYDDHEVRYPGFAEFLPSL